MIWLAKLINPDEKKYYLAFSAILMQPYVYGYLILYDYLLFTMLSTVCKEQLRNQISLKCLRMCILYPACFLKSWCKGWYSSQTGSRLIWTSYTTFFLQIQRLAFINEWSICWRNERSLSSKGPVLWEDLYSALPTSDRFVLSCVFFFLVY